MKASIIARTLTGLCALAVSCCIGLGQTFTSGSDGSYGPIDLGDPFGGATLQMPPDGVFHCTTIRVVGTLRFSRNALNTPVFLLATGDVVIAGIIDVSGFNNSGNAGGQGGPGGFDGGFFCCGAGQGPGGGIGNQASIAGAAHAASSGSNSNIYGNILLTPLIGGSGGAAGFGNSVGYGGGGGGGAIIIASTTRVVMNGTIRANGNAGYGGGSGGSIRIVAPSVSGGGRLEAVGTRGFAPGAVDGSYGRTRIDSLDRFGRANIQLTGRSSFGSQMFVFPTGLPRLDIVQAAGLSIPEDTTNSVSIILPAGTSTNQLVRVQARGLTNNIPITVVVVPDYGSAVQYPAVIQNTGNPSFVDVNVVLPYDMVTHIHAWTR